MGDSKRSGRSLPLSDAQVSERAPTVTIGVPAALQGGSINPLRGGVSIFEQPGFPLLLSSPSFLVRLSLPPMNALATPTAASAVNRASSPPSRPIETFARRAAGQLDRLARREPDKAIAVVAGALVALRVVPLRWIVRSAATLARPALLVLGACKACELAAHNFNLLTKDESTPRRPRH
jgi:hypothetical protein